MIRLKLDDLQKDSLYYFVARIFPALSGLLSIMIFVRLLGRETYGNYALVQASVLFIGNVAPIWISQSILRYYSRFDSPQSRKIFNTAVLSSTIVTVFIFITAFLIFACFYLHLSLVNLLIASFSAMTLTLYAILASLRQTMLNPRKIVLAEFCRGFFVIAVPLALVFLFGFRNYTVLLLGPAAAYLIATCSILKGTQLNFMWNSNFVRIIKRVLLPFGIPIALWLGLSTLLNTSDRYIIKYFMDAKAVGTYSAIYDVVYNSFGLMLAPVLYAAHPRIVRLWNSRKEKDSLYLLKKAIFLELVIGIIALLILNQIAPFLSRIILGTNDIQAARLVTPVAAGAIFWQLAMLIHKPLELKRKTIRMLIYVACALGVNFIGNIFLVPLYGYIASAYITTLSAFIYMILVLMDIGLSYFLSNRRHSLTLKSMEYRRAI
jgi:O-antigen/teichoic acid export membrane protein